MDWNYWLGRKYAVQDQSAAADTLRAQAGMISANAGANLDTVRAGLLPAESRAGIGLTNAQAGLAGASARQQNEETKYIGQKALADIFATRQQGGLYRSEATGNNLLNRGFQLDLGGDTSQRNPLLDKILRNFNLPSLGLP